jgi:hypothetical protein
LKPLEILIRNDRNIRVQLRDERDHARWEGLGGTRGQLRRFEHERGDYQLLV